ncbi:electron transfer flavoprotein subunit beta/FixA family protein [Aneurinibacillus aneurinilyticus]|jgi:electron transfer flavoprotein beta subunit|uniref:Electron transfer flavoprotein subunit beta n=1 Tax=Aneurinibacillus aneurinilyticus ATCC 12856 TaxID=649747 RepID=U1X0Y5_ANEAE|nr:electron transfer flavoprotein subunit beta/FixA family protein [Aneurinibacillus aneurinilyticus]ERI08178.1 electron transfer flavoprotein subunit beta [Aneurinibacillus aneurinilyticus ATCC 12856]MED0706205.1 electron transfer flavoprotein subunit beta/FixA family protein [Aneurinibacillus aneurinilyticus]MED0724595.1 electron transfer flavoprotein subunit beta/FixA family protein [Aneurinibacillus aneurinilyticus]MED0734853.1 electron transfer flavoprotein subunit beta/FixA family protein
MNILVCLKQTFDTEEKIVLENGTISEDGVEFIMNPYDEYAVEEAITLRDEHGGEVTVITVGPERAESALRTALAMGADKAVIVDDEEIHTDEYSVAKILAAVIKDREYDIILGGNMAVDNGSGQVGPRLAEELNIAQVTTITKLSVDGGKATIERDVEGDTETIEVSLPVLVTAQQGLNEPRYPSLPGIMKAKKKPMERLTIDDLGIDGEVAAKTSVIETFLPPKKEAGRILSGDVADQVKELVQLLRNEAKVI